MIVSHSQKIHSIKINVKLKINVRIYFYHKYLNANYIQFNFEVSCYWIKYVYIQYIYRNIRYLILLIPYRETNKIYCTLNNLNILSICMKLNEQKSLWCTCMFPSCTMYEHYGLVAIQIQLTCTILNYVPNSKWVDYWQLHTSHIYDDI